MPLFKTHSYCTPGYNHTSVAAAYNTAAVAAAAYNIAVAEAPAAAAGAEYFYKSHKQTDPQSSSHPYYLQRSAHRG